MGGTTQSTAPDQIYTHLIGDVLRAGLLGASARLIYYDSKAFPDATSVILAGYIMDAAITGNSLVINTLSLMCTDSESECFDCKPTNWQACKSLLTLIPAVCELAVLTQMVLDPDNLGGKSSAYAALTMTIFAQLPPFICVPYSILKSTFCSNAEGFEYDF